MRPLRIATRASRLALVQTRHVVDLLAGEEPGLQVRELRVRTRGDRDRRSDLPDLSRSSGVGYFVREVESALLDERADIAVHSLKDLPTGECEGLLLAAVPPREDPRDALVPAPAPGAPGPLGGLRPGARVGTGSPRRRAQLLALRADLDVRPVRGNVPTRLAMAGPGLEFDAVVLAYAGLRRLGLEGGSAPLAVEHLLPAPGQGALAVQCRSGDEEVRALLARIEDPRARAAVEAERAFLARLEGGCALPAGAFAEPIAGSLLRLRCVVGHPRGGPVLRGEDRGPAAHARELGTRLAESLLERGAAELLGDL